MSSTSYVAAEVEPYHTLIEGLVRDHRVFPVLLSGLAESLQGRRVDEMRRHFLDLQDALTEHMLVEETEVYPELWRQGRFDERTSCIMQQHHDVSASLTALESALRVLDFVGFGHALEELRGVLGIHQPAEEEDVFPKLDSAPAVGVKEFEPSA